MRKSDVISLSLSLFLSIRAIFFMCLSGCTFCLWFFVVVLLSTNAFTWPLYFLASFMCFCPLYVEYVFCFLRRRWEMTSKFSVSETIIFSSLFWQPFIKKRLFAFCLFVCLCLLVVLLFFLCAINPHHQTKTQS